VERAVDRVGVMIVQLLHLPQSVRVPRNHAANIKSTQNECLLKPSV
jgi:hypothetical protein